MKVREQFSIDADQLYTKSFDNEYWLNSYRFYMDVKDKDMEDLTIRQEVWLEKIERQLED
jgi:hypothetical protein